MLDKQQRQVISLSLSPKALYLLDKICQKEDKSRSAAVRALIRQYAIEKKWQEIFNLGEKTAKKYKIRSEADILKLLND